MIDKQMIIMEGSAYGLYVALRVPFPRSKTSTTSIEIEIRSKYLRPNCIQIIDGNTTKHEQKPAWHTSKIMRLMWG